MHAYVCVEVKVLRPEQALVSCLSFALHCVALRQGLSLNWAPTILARLADEQTCCWGYRHAQSCQTFHVGAGDLKSDPHVCRANPLTHQTISLGSNFFSL